MTPGDDVRPDRRPPLIGDEAELFREFHPKFVRIVQKRTGGVREIVDDACAFAWQKFVQLQPSRDRNWRAWLVTTAEREAWRLHAAERNHLSLSIEQPEGREPASWDMPDERDQSAIRERLREALQAFSELPERRRDIKGLQVTGFSYDEIAEMRGLSYTRVNRLLTEANAALRDSQGRAASTRTHALPRAERLHELERRPPAWLRSAIGRPPTLHDSRHSLLAWRRAALALDDYRRIYGRGLGDEPLGERPAAREAARAFDFARCTMERAIEAGSPGRRRGVER
jgi:RNA polymerase sigma factor (sigma-70 family)